MCSQIGAMKDKHLVSEYSMAIKIRLSGMMTYCVMITVSKSKIVDKN